MSQIQQHADGAVVFEGVVLLGVDWQLQVWQHWCGDWLAVGESEGGEDVVDLAALLDVELAE